MNGQHEKSSKNNWFLGFHLAKDGIRVATALRYLKDKFLPNPIKKGFFIKNDGNFRPGHFDLALLPALGLFFAKDQQDR